jgi:lipopolysaccharide assembly protein A
MRLSWQGRDAVRKDAVRYIYITLIVLFAGILVLFKFQNLEAVTVSLLSASITLPVSVLVLLIYVLGMLTGGFVLALLRIWIHGASRRPD